MNIPKGLGILCVALWSANAAAASSREIAALRPMQRLTGSDVVTLGNLGLGQTFSISFWAKPGKGNPEWAAIVDYRHQATKSFAFHQKGNQEHVYAFGVHSRDGVNGVYVKLRPFEWQHVVLLKGSNSMAIYVNGAEMDRAALARGAHIDYAGDEVLTIGGWGYGNRRWLGSISCVYVYDKQLDLSAIKGLAAQTGCKDEYN